MASPTATALDLLTTPEGVADPFPLYDALRSASPIPGYRDWPPGTVPGADEPVTAWALFRYDDVFQAARDNATFSSRDPLQEASSAPSLMLVNTDPPTHTIERKLVSQAFSPRRVTRLEGWLAELLPVLLDGLGDGDLDVMAFAAEVPTRAMVRLLGLPEGDHVRFKRWANAFMLSSAMTAAERMASNEEMVAAFTQRLAEHAGRLAEHPPTGDVDDADDLISALLRAEIDGQRLTPEEIVRFCVTLVVAGSETTTYLIGNLLHVLARHPETASRLRADRTLLGPFIEETMRLDGPPQRLFRIATRDVEIGGASIRRGDWVALFFGAANRDPAVFPDPERFDIDRPNIRQQLSLGHGLHFCLGAALARLEVLAVLDAVLDRYSGIELTDDPGTKQSASLLTHGFVRLPLRLTR
ncbi:putative cytochrome P450 123 [Mycobacterium antarcticum]|uniref:cytochrome P450 n=1 Tax=unclassified Mycolicibacterium TaxID=2636767 RepID=UPI002391A823|nr:MULTISPECIES: cytochrome P450 [unclassified Mycolicibacterium]BDX29936.1 putative cytochrome P450 123 [Mycolicibacterium sp. TUM20985]GLP73358.1 putative cytochrome P450 123 [Mycolicibacterium sp. TUM20983]GLP79072.1 putative cytochrome P450 123 [Mycolicibacterium sp. TUM20984]